MSQVLCSKSLCVHKASLLNLIPFQTFQQNKKPLGLSATSSARAAFIFATQENDNIYARLKTSRHSAFLTV